MKNIISSIAFALIWSGGTYLQKGSFHIQDEDWLMIYGFGIGMIGFVTSKLISDYL